MGHGWTVEVDINAMEAKRIAIASTMTVLIGLFQVGLSLTLSSVMKNVRISCEKLKLLRKFLKFKRFYKYKRFVGQNIW